MKNIQKILSRCRLAIEKYDMIENGDKIAVGVSGGKDSLVLLLALAEIKKFLPRSFELVAITVDMGFDTCETAPAPKNDHKGIRALCESIGVPYIVKETELAHIIFDVRRESNPCSLCSRMRRGILHDTAKEAGCNKIALGHHFNDVIETTVMGMLWGGQLQGMMPKLHSKNFPGMELIRPLYRVHEEDIIAWKNAHELSFIQCACRFTENCTLCDNGGGGSKRQEVKQLLKRLNRDGGKVEKNVFNAIHMLQFDTFPGWKSKGEEHTFLEWYDAGEE